MLEWLFGEIFLRHILVSLAILAASIGVAWIFRVFLVKMAHRLAKKTTTNLDDAIIAALSKPIIAAIILVGVYLAALYLPVEPTPHLYISRGLFTILGLLGVYTGAALLDALIRWYEHETLDKRKEGALTTRFLTFFRIGIVLAALLLAVVVALEIWGVSTARVTGWLGQHGWRIALIFILLMTGIIVIGEVVPRIIVKTLARRAGESEEETVKRSETLSRVLVGAGQVFILVIAIFTVLSELDIDIAPILAGVGVAGIAIGFGAQSLVKDILSGLFIILENQYRVGDVVRIADIAGLVEDINLRRTMLRDLDGIVHVVPNGEIRVASNFTKEYSRVNLNISVSYGTDLDKAIAVANRVGKELAEDPNWAPLILKPPQVLRVDKLGDSGIDIKILGDTKPIRQWDVTGELRLRLKKAFDLEGIEIPWPHTKVYFGNSPFENGQGPAKDNRGK